MDLGQNGVHKRTLPSQLQVLDLNGCFDLVITRWTVECFSLVGVFKFYATSKNRFRLNMMSLCVEHQAKKKTLFFYLTMNQVSVNLLRLRLI